MEKTTARDISRGLGLKIMDEPEANSLRSAEERLMTLYAVIDKHGMVASGLADKLGGSAPSAVSHGFDPEAPVAGGMVDRFATLISGCEERLTVISDALLRIERLIGQSGFKPAPQTMPQTA